MKSRPMRGSVLWAIRDARGLDSYEKAFLFAVETRGSMKCAWEKAAADMGMKKDTFYRTRSRLIQRGLITAKESGNRVTEYRVVAEAVKSLVPPPPDPHSLTENDSLTENGLSPTANGLSPTENGDSLRAEQKVTMKETKEENPPKRSSSSPSGEDSGEAEDWVGRFFEVDDLDQQKFNRMLGWLMKRHNTKLIVCGLECFRDWEGSRIAMAEKPAAWITTVFPKWFEENLEDIQYALEQEAEAV